MLLASGVSVFAHFCGSLLLLQKPHSATIERVSVEIVHVSGIEVKQVFHLLQYNLTTVSREVYAGMPISPVVACEKLEPRIWEWNWLSRK